MEQTFKPTIGRPVGSSTIRSRVKPLIDCALSALEAIAKDQSARASDRIAAAREILDRADTVK